MVKTMISRRTWHSTWVSVHCLPDSKSLFKFYVLFYVLILEKQKEYLTDWSAWTECSPPCDPSVHRTRERNCSVAGGCKELGHRFETDSCRPEKKCFGM